jgi:hypothetical protein
MTQTRVWLVDPPKRVTGRRAVPRITRHNGCAQRGTRVTEVLLPLRPILFVDLKGSAAVRGRKFESCYDEKKLPLLSVSQSLNTKKKL